MITKLLIAMGIGAAAVAAVPQISNLVQNDASQGAQVTAPLATPAITTPETPRIVPLTKGDAIASYAPVVRSASGAVVNVYARSVQRGRVAVDPFWGAMRLPDRASLSQGSGVIVRDDGIIVTNNHVVQGATEMVVVLGDRREFPASVVLTDPRTDLAVLRINTGGQRLNALSFADTTNAQVGDQVLAIGNPFGVGQTVTSGIISALARTDVGITDYSFFIQTDASINPGNSGGALVDMSGKLVGINTAIFSGSGSSAGVGFAIPAEMVRRVVEGAVSVGRVVRPWSGVRGQTVDSEMAATMNLARPGGVLVTEVHPNSAAAQAGLRRGDVIVSLGGSEVNDESGLRYLAATKAPNEAVVFEFYRGGRKLDGRGILSVPPGRGSADSRVIEGKNSFGGLSVATLNPALADEKGLDPFSHGVVVTAVAPNSAAQQSGFQIGDLIVEINGDAIENIEALNAKLAREERGQVTIKRGDRPITAVLDL